MVAKLRMHTTLSAWVALVALALSAALSLVPTHAAAIQSSLCGDSSAPACNGECPTGQVCVPVESVDHTGALANECDSTGPNSAGCVLECQCIEGGAGVTRSLLDVQR